VRTDPGACADLHAGADNRVRSDFDIGAKARAVVYDGGRVNTSGHGTLQASLVIL
jgi:hypothetical protein